MENLLLRQFEMFQRVEELVRLRPDAFPGSTYSGNLFSSLAEVIGKITEHFKIQVAQMDVARSSHTSKAAIKTELLKDLKLISKNADLIGSTIVGIEEKFNLPARLNESELLNRARVIAETATTHEQEFLKQEMEADFLSRLNALIAAYEEAIDKTETATDAHVAATAAIEEQVEKGLELVKRIGVVIENRLYNDKEITQAWDRARRVEKARTASKKEKPPAETPEAPPAKPV